MKNIILIVADSLRRDTWEMVCDGTGLEYMVKSCNSCTELSLPWMLSGLEVFSPTMSIPTDLKKHGYHTQLIHSNSIVDRFRHPFNETIDLSTGNKREEITRKYNRIRNLAQQYLPNKTYTLIKKLIRGKPDKYLPYARAEETLEYFTNHTPDSPYFSWIHLMDPHTPYFPTTTNHSLEWIIDNNDNQISAVRGYYKPTIDEALFWKRLYQTEITEMWRVLKPFLGSINYSETTVVFTSDHGEEFGEHKEYGHKGNRFNRENIEVPFTVYGKRLPNYEVMDHSQLRQYIRGLVR